MKRNTESPLYRASRPLPRNKDYNSADWRRYEGHGKARSVARIYAALACGGTLDGYESFTAMCLQRLRSEVAGRAWTS